MKNEEMEIGSPVTLRGYLEVLENLFILRNMFPIDLKKGVEAFNRMRKVYYHIFFIFLKCRLRKQKNNKPLFFLIIS